MGFDAHVRQHAAEDHLTDAALAQLQNEVVGLRAEDFVWTDDDRLAVLDIGLEAINPVPSWRTPPGLAGRSAQRHDA